MTTETAGRIEQLTRTRRPEEPRTRRTRPVRKMATLGNDARNDARRASHRPQREAHLPECDAPPSRPRPVKDDRTRRGPPAREYPVADVRYPSQTVFTELHRSAPWLQTVPFTPASCTLGDPARCKGDERPARGTAVRLYIYLYDELAIEVGVGDDNHDEPLTIHPGPPETSRPHGRHQAPTNSTDGSAPCCRKTVNTKHGRWPRALRALKPDSVTNRANVARDPVGKHRSGIPRARRASRARRPPPTWSNTYTTLTDEEIGTRLHEAAVTAAGARRGRTDDPRRTASRALRRARQDRPHTPSRTAAGAPRATTRSNGWESRNANWTTGSLARRESKRSVSEAAPLVGLRAAETRARVFGDQQAGA